MRTTTLPCMMETLSRNNAYRNKAAKLYEMAKVYLPVEGEDLPKEDVILTLGTYGASETFFTMKGEIETLLKALNAQKRTCTAVRNNPSYHPGRCAELCVGGIPVGLFGQVHRWWQPITESTARCTAQS